jgi:hypothetical protein
MFKVWRNSPPRQNIPTVSPKPENLGHPCQRCFAETQSIQLQHSVLPYVSSDPPESVPVPQSAVTFDQHNCRNTTRVLAFRVGQGVSISKNEDFSHNVHPHAKISR